jgi:hypothetical protein
MTEYDHPCEEIEPDDKRTHSQVVYCPAWDLYLCADCRIRKNDAELRIWVSKRKKSPDWNLPVEPMRQ